MKRLIVQTKIRPFSNLYYLTPLYCLLNDSSCWNKRLLFTYGDSVLFFFNLYLEQRGDNSFQEEKVLWASAIAQDTSDSGCTFSTFISVILCSKVTSFQFPSNSWSFVRFEILGIQVIYLDSDFNMLWFDCFWSTYERDHQDKLLLSQPKHCCINIWWLFIFSWSNFRSYVTGIFNMFALITF